MFSHIGWTVLTKFFFRVPGEAGRSLIQRYFEAEHSATAIIHPKTDLAPSTPVRRDRRSTPRSASNSGQRTLLGFQPRPIAPGQSLQPAYRSIYGQAAPAYTPYSGYAPVNSRLPPAQFPYGTVTNSRGGFTTYPMYGHGSYSSRYRIE